MSERVHPSLAQLVAEPLGADIEHHLLRCLECRIQVRLMAPRPPATDTSTPSVVSQMQDEWGSVAQRLRSGRPPRFELTPPLDWRQNRGDAAVVAAVDTSTGHSVDLGMVIRPVSDDPGQLAALVGHEIPSLAPVREVLPRGNEVFFVTDLPGVPVSMAGADVAISPQHGLRELVLALGALHTRGIVHGDVAPQSIRVTQAAPGTFALVLGPPVAHPGEAGPHVDWQQLGVALLTLVAPSDVSLTRLLDRLAAGPAMTDEAVVTALLELCRGTHDGRNYHPVDHLGTGGTALVHRAFDARLGREVAYKVVRDDRRTVADVARWRADAQFMARLPHPGIPQVHEFGTQPDGRPYYTMQILGDGTLEEKIREVHRRGPLHGEPADGGWTMRRLVQALQSATEAVAFAHDRNIVHRDLKPANILVGDFGFVQVGDWGHAIDLSDPTAPGTLQHGPLGTRGYMPPEQDRHHPTSHPPGDVFAIGATLHHVLHGVPPGGGERELSPADALLGDLVSRCTSPSPADRPATAGVVAEELRTWLDGSMARERARARLPGVRAQWEEVQSLRARAADEHAMARQRLAEVADHEGVAAKLAGWRLQDAATKREQQASRLQVEVVGQLQSILRDAPGHPPAEALLTEHYLECLQRADASGNPLDIQRYEALLEQRPGHQHSLYVKGIGTVSLRTDPQGAQVVAKRFVEVDRRLVLRGEEPLGETPLERVELPMGSWMLDVRAPHHEPMHYPVYLGRGDHWDGVPPGGDTPYTVPLLRDGALGDDECYVPAGWFRCGGNTEISGGFPERRLWCDGFVMQRHAVTHSQYLAFLNALVRAGRADEAARYVPPEFGRPEHQPQYVPDAAGQLEARPRVPDSRWGLDWPAAAMDWGAAWAFASAFPTASPDGWRLPHEFEWEKAARGVDARRFPWGNRGDPGFTNMQLSHRIPHARPVTDLPFDVSPYGVVGLGGNVAAWCANRIADADRLESDERVVPAQRPSDSSTDSVAARGGSFASELRFCEAMVRMQLAPDRRGTRVGIRLVRSVGTRS